MGHVGCVATNNVIVTGYEPRPVSSARYRAVEPSSGSSVIPRRARPGLAGLWPHTPHDVIVTGYEHPLGYMGPVRCVATSPDNSVIVTGYEQ